MDVERVIERLNGFTIYRFRLTVKMAKYEGKRGVRASWGKVWGRQERGGSKLGKGLGQASHEKVTPKKSDKEEIFSNVELCSENPITKSSRATWLEVSGENVNHVLDYKTISILVTTTNEKKISGVVEIEARNMSYVVRVEEIRFTD
ncbi:hypothetical protein V6N13_019835 [Hibiscus sabdariffa]